MDSLSVLNTQNIAASNQAQSEQQSASDRAKEDAEEKKTEFLQLLLTQLENQNPLDPMKTQEFTAQLTRYSILEQGIETNANLEITNDLLQKNSNNTTLSYIGEDVEVASNTAPPHNGQSEWSYTVDGNADNVILSVLDDDGNVVYEQDGNTGPGVHDFALDAQALGIEDGTPLELVIAARDAEGEALKNKVTSNATIDGIWTNEENTYLTSGAVSFRIEDILKVAALGDNETGTGTGEPEPTT